MKLFLIQSGRQESTAVDTPLIHPSEPILAVLLSIVADVVAFDELTVEEHDELVVVVSSEEQEIRTPTIRAETVMSILVFFIFTSHFS